MSVCHAGFHPTTYLDAHAILTISPQVRFSKPPSFVRKFFQGIRFQKTRFFPIIPKGPCRTLSREEPPCYSLACTGIDTHWYDGSPKTAQDVNNLLHQQMARKTVSESPSSDEDEKTTSATSSAEDIELKNGDSFIWSTTSERANKEAALPIPKVDIQTSDLGEDQAELLMKRRQQNQSRLGNWQEVAESWDQCQLRPNANAKWTCKDMTASLLARQTIKSQREIMNCPVTKEIVFEEFIKLPESKLSRRTMGRYPGYGGHVPKYPIIPKEPVPDFMSSVMKISYKSIPAYELKTSIYGFHRMLPA